MAELRKLGIQKRLEKKEEENNTLKVALAAVQEKLKVELEGGRIVLRKDVDDAQSRVRGRFKLDGFASTDEAMRAIRGHAPGDPYLPPEPDSGKEGT